MHPCLQIEEIADSICWYLESHELLVFALTNRRFKRPCLSTLWRVLPGIMPLLNLFPDDAKTMPTIKVDPGGLAPKRDYFKRPLCPSDWQLASSYTPYVREFTFDHRYVSANFTSLITIAETCNGSYIFPNLRLLVFHFYHAEHYLFAQRLFPPTLTHVSLNLRDVISLIPVISQLGTQCPNMVSFECFYSAYYKDTVQLIDALSQAVCRWNALEEFRFSSLSPQIMQHISQLPRFTSLSLHESPVLHDHFPNHPNTFSSLRFFESSDRSLHNSIQAMSTLQTRVLEGIELDILDYDEQTALQWEELFRVVAKCSQNAEPLTLKVNRNPPIPLPPFQQDFITRPEALRPLLVARNLQELDLSNCYYFALEDDLIEDLTKASPQLRVLKIGTSWATGCTPTLTIDSWMHVFEHCPKITSLGLVVDTSIAERYLARKPGGGRIKPVAGDFYLHVGDSPVEYPKEVAAFLSAFLATFPEEIETADETPEDVVNGWEEVRELLDIFIQVRKQEQDLKDSIET